jgi:5-methylcytosine-specific restriction endonuclease McrA
MTDTPGKETLSELKSMPYNEYLKTEHWQRVRKWALAIAAYKCQACASEKALHVHHNNYERRGEELPSDVVVFCDKCHQKFHDILPQPPTYQVIVDTNNYEPKQHRPFADDEDTLDQDKAIWEGINKSGWLKVPKNLFRLMDFEKAGFLTFLVDWAYYHVEEKSVRQNKCWFYCSERNLTKHIHGFKRCSQQRLFRWFEKQGYLETRMVYGKKIVNGMKVHSNHRMIHINFNKIKEDVEAAKKTKEMAKV